jgi:hypothetical protein
MSEEHPNPTPDDRSVPAEPIYVPQQNILADRAIEDVAKAMKGVSEGVCHNDLQKQAAQTYIKHFIQGSKHEETKALKDYLDGLWRIIGQHLRDEREKTLDKLTAENGQLDKQRNDLWLRRHGNAKRPRLRTEIIKDPFNLSYTRLDAWRFTRQEEQKRVDEFCDFLGKDDVALADNTRALAKTIAHLIAEVVEVKSLLEQATADGGWIDTAKHIKPQVIKIMEETAKNKQLKKDIEGLEGSVQYDLNL